MFRRGSGFVGVRPSRTREHDCEGGALTTYMNDALASKTGRKSCMVGEEVYCGLVGAAGLLPSTVDAGPSSRMGRPSADTGRGDRRWRPLDLKAHARLQTDRRPLGWTSLTSIHASQQCLGLGWSGARCRYLRCQRLGRASPYHPEGRGAGAVPSVSAPKTHTGSRPSQRPRGVPPMDVALVRASLPVAGGVGAAPGLTPEIARRGRRAPAPPSPWSETLTGSGYAPLATESAAGAGANRDDPRNRLRRDVISRPQ